MSSRNEYLLTIQERYLKACSKEEKTKILNECIQTIKQNRKYLIRKLQPRNDLQEEKQRKKRKPKYDSYVKIPLIKIWEILEYPCSKRLKPMIEEMLEVLERHKELKVSEEIEEKLLEISSRTIDRKLKHQKQYLHRKRFSTTRPGSLLKSQIPIKLTEWDTSKVGFTEADLVAHCGDNVAGEYVNSLNVTEIYSGWAEQAAVMGKGQRNTFLGIVEVRKRSPFKWLGIDSDNDAPFINYHMLKYCKEEKLEFTRSRPNRKNDNAYVEQKNWTHIRKIFGWKRYDTKEEQKIINDLYQNEIRLYKNFFQPVMKMIKKKRVGPKIIKKYDIPKTPYRRLMESGQITRETRKQLKEIYLTLNPVKLKKNIEIKLGLLEKAYQRKIKIQNKTKKLKLKNRN